MAILEYWGCPPQIPCWGPAEQWWLFNVPLAAYPSILLWSAIAGVIGLAVYVGVQKMRKQQMTWKGGLLSFGITFLALLVLIVAWLAYMQSNTIY